MALVMTTGHSMKQVIAYYRVSTARQGRSGLGLEAQQVMAQRFADQEGFSIAQAFVETESAKHDDSRRPQLKAALEAARKLKAPILVAKLDRLSRDVAYIGGVMEDGVAVIVV